MIPYGRQSISEDDVAAVVEALRSDWITQGPAIERFERGLAERVGAAHGIAVCNATGALHIACLALGVGPGDLVWTSPNTFLASANCARYCGAQVDFVDIDPHTYNMDPAALEAKLRQAKADGRLPKVVIPVHYAGLSCDMRAIHALAQEYGFAIIEDASHAVGGDHEGQPVGACRYSDMTVFSFHPVKILTTAEGGMVMTNRADLDKSLRLLRSHGMTRVREELQRPDEGAWYYEQVALGYNYRMTDLQAALGASQLSRLDSFIARRRALAARYDALLQGLPLQVPARVPYAESAWHLYTIHIDEKRAGKTRRQVFDAMRAAGIGVNVLYIPVYWQPDFARAFGFTEGLCPHAEHIYRGALSLPMFYSLTEAEQDTVVAALKEALA